MLYTYVFIIFDEIMEYHEKDTETHILLDLFVNYQSLETSIQKVNHLHSIISDFIPFFTSVDVSSDTLNNFLKRIRIQLTLRNDSYHQFDPFEFLYAAIYDNTDINAQSIHVSDLRIPIDSNLS